MVFNNFQNAGQGKELSYTEFLSAVESNQVEKVTISGQTITGTQQGGGKFETILPVYDDKLMDAAQPQCAGAGRKPEKQRFLYAAVAGLFTHFDHHCGLYAVYASNAGRRRWSRRPMAFGKSKAKLLSEDQIKTTFEDVAGCDEAKEDVKELVEFYATQVNTNA